MARRLVRTDAMEEKLDYIGLDLENIPETLMKAHKLNFRPLKGYDEKKYNQYRYIDVNNIDILLTPTNRLTELKEKYEKAKPLGAYLNSKENFLDHNTFLSMIKKVEISEIQEIEKEQELLSKKLPFKVKYNRNYLWQIYYAENTDRYFMLLPTKDTEYSTLFYLIKKKLENKKDNKIFVPISYVDYTNNVLKTQELKDLENYLWLFTKDYPSIYEVYDKNKYITLQIIGEAQIYGKIKTLYKIILETPKEASKLYKLLKALFILQTELPRYYNFTTNIEAEDRLNMYLNNEKIKYEDLPEFVLEQYIKSVKLKEKVQEEVELLNIKLNELKKQSLELESEYFSKEKQISTFLECKKSFFGKVKYYFKLGKSYTKNPKKAKVEDQNKEEDAKKEEQRKSKKKQFKVEDRRYTLDELVISFKELEILENNQKNAILDINAIKLKNKNFKKKIENATLYINEINEHKKSIFEFWKYSNKDEVMALEEGEEEELNITKVEKTFNFEEDFEQFSLNIDKEQRKKFTDSELDSSYIATTELLSFINKTYKKDVNLKDFSEMVKTLKDKKYTLDSNEDDEFEVFGTLSKNNRKEKLLGNKSHREAPRDMYEILDIKKGSRGIEFKKAIVSVINDLKKALKKDSLSEDMYVYKAVSDDLDLQGFQALSLDESDELETYLKKNKLKRKNNLYRIKLPKGTNFIAFSNIIYYNNKNMTLPVGMNRSNKILVDLSTLNLEEINTKTLGKAYLENEKDDFSRVILKTILVHEYECKKEI